MDKQIEERSELRSKIRSLIEKRSKHGDQRIRITVLTSNLFKMKEFELYLQKYSINVTFANPSDDIESIIAASQHSPHYILREESWLIDVSKHISLNGCDIINNPESAPDLLKSKSHLTVYIPVWSEDNQLIGIDKREYTHSMKGYIDSTRKSQSSENVFGWDHLFIHAATGYSIEDYKLMGFDKLSPRQCCISEFILDYLLYKKPKALVHNLELKPTRAIEFTKEMSVYEFMMNNKFLNNKKLKKWELDLLRLFALYEGVYFKAPTSIQVRNYFTPPLSGLPIVAKPKEDQSEIEETIFMMHDLLHHIIPDLLISSEKGQYVYICWRMMSEAMTIILADMLYANTLVCTDPTYRDHVDQRIYPLFEALDIKECNWDVVKKILYANVQYAVLGDDEEWKKLLNYDPEKLKVLQKYKDHFEKFFVGDHIWAHKNYLNMTQSHTLEQYQYWINSLGKEHFRNNNLILLDDVVNDFESSNVDLNNMKSVVEHMFNYVFERRVKPRDVEPVDLETQISRAFMRYMIGQLNLYARYRNFGNMMQRCENIINQLKTKKYSRDKIRQQFENDVKYLWSIDIITEDQYENYIGVYPLFPPCFIKYNDYVNVTIKDKLNELYGLYEPTK